MSGGKTKTPRCFQQGVPHSLFYAYRLSIGV